jgi:hypothetical protein
LPLTHNQRNKQTKLITAEISFNYTDIILADNIPPIEEAMERKPYGLRIF